MSEQDERLIDRAAAQLMIVEAEVVRRTAAAGPMSPTPQTPWIGAVIGRAIAGAKDRERRQPRPLHPPQMKYLDHSRMAREMYRL